MLSWFNWAEKRYFAVEIILQLPSTERKLPIKPNVSPVMISYKIWQRLPTPISFSTKNTWRKLSLIRAIWNLFNFPLISISAQNEIAQRLSGKNQKLKKKLFWTLTYNFDDESRLWKMGVCISPVFFKEHSWASRSEEIFCSRTMTSFKFTSTN